MYKTIFSISKMDCPSEESLIRMKLDVISGIKNLEFDISNRKLTVFHNGQLELIEKSIIELNLGGKKLTSELSNQTQFEEHTIQRKLLWAVLVINLAFFIIEITTGIISAIQTSLETGEIPRRIKNTTKITARICGK